MAVQVVLWLLHPFCKRPCCQKQFECNPPASRFNGHTIHKTIYESHLDVLSSQFMFENPIINIWVDHYFQNNSMIPRKPPESAYRIYFNQVEGDKSNYGEFIGESLT